MSQPDIWTSSDLGVEALVVRILIAAALGAALGLEREARNRNAGLKTHMLTSVAAATFTMLTLELFMKLSTQSSGNPDPIRIIDAVTSGIAFIAAGAIIRNEDKVRGLTTGATMWLSGAVGACAGSGYFTLALLAAGSGVFVMTLIRWLEVKTFGNDE